MNSNIMKKLIDMSRLKTVKNGFWLYILQIFNTVVPLFTLPYITRVLGPTNYGIFSSALNLVTYLQVIVEYGFNLSGPRKIALNKNNKNVSQVYARVTFSRTLLCFFTFVLMIFMSIALKISKEQFLNMLILYTMVIGTSIQQTWLFQGLEDMKFITITSVVSRSVSVVLIFLLVKNADQVYLYSVLYALTYLLVGIITTLIARIKYNIKIQKVSLIDVFEEIKDGWYLFTTSAMSKIFSGIGITVLVFSSTDLQVGIYNAIYKIPLIMKMIYAPIGQVIFPYISKYYSISFKAGILRIKNISKYILLPFILIAFILALNSNTIIRVLYGNEYALYSNILIPLIIWVVLSIINNLLGIQILVASGHMREYSIAFRIGVFFIIVFNVIFGILWNVIGVSVAAMLAELTLTFAIIYQIMKIKHNLINVNEVY